MGHQSVGKSALSGVRGSFELAEGSREPAAAIEAGELRDRALRLLAVGVGDHAPIEVQERVAEIARRLAQLEAPAHERA